MAKRKSRQAPAASSAKHQSIPETHQLGPAQPGSVIANYGASLVVENQDGKQVRCVARQTLAALVCGDRVMWQAENEENGRCQIGQFDERVIHSGNILFAAAGNEITPVRRNPTCDLGKPSSGQCKFSDAATRAADLGSS